MKYLVRAGVIAAIGLATAGVAMATPIELTATSGTGGTSVLLPGGGGQVTYSNQNFYGWNISLAYGRSNSPSLGLSLLTATADCSIAACAPLTLAVSEVGFTMPIGANGLSTVLTNENVANADNGVGGPSTVTQWAYMDTSNAYFGSTDSNAMSDFSGSYNPGTASLIGMLSLNGGGYVTSAPGGDAATGPYSLTLVQQFCSDPPGGDGTCSGGLSMQAAGGITTAPEPGGLALFGAGLLGVALFAGRRRSSKVRA